MLSVQRFDLRVGLFDLGNFFIRCNLIAGFLISAAGALGGRVLFLQCL
jgi:hypothetical protein